MACHSVQVFLNWWFGLVVWGFEPLVLVEGKLGTTSNHQATNPSQQSVGS